MMRYLFVLILLFGERDCQDLNEHAILHLQPFSQDASVPNVNGYNSNILQTNNAQYYTVTEDYSRSDKGRNKKLYRIKNPFHRPSDDIERQEKADSFLSDSTSGASNQYSAQYALPPDDFLRQMRSESQYYQQPQLTSSSNMGYTATPQPPYEHTTSQNLNYDGNNLQVNQGSQYDYKMPQLQPIVSNYNSYQYSTSNPLGLNHIQNTSPLPGVLSSPLISNFGESPASSYVSSSSPVFLSTSANLHNIVSSPYSGFQTGFLDYSKILSSIGSNPYNHDNIDSKRKMQSDHNGNSVNNMKYPINLHNQYQNEFSSPTSLPAPKITDSPRDLWLNAANYGINSLSKSLQDVNFTPFYNISHNSQDLRQGNVDNNNNSESPQTGNIPSANNMILNLAHADYQITNRNRIRNVEQEVGNSEMYSEGDYGWKLQNTKNTEYAFNDGHYTDNYPKQSLVQVPENKATSHINFHMNIEKPIGLYNAPDKSSSSESLDAQEFTKAAAKVHENMKKQQFYNNNNDYTHNDQVFNQHPLFQESHTQDTVPSPYSLQDAVTVSPNYQYYSRESPDENFQRPFDHDKVLKNMVPIDALNVVSNYNIQTKMTDYDKNNRYHTINHNKDQIEYYKALTDAFYKDKNAGYEYDIKTKQYSTPSTDILRYSEPSSLYSENYQSPNIQSGIYENKRILDGATQSESFITHTSNNYWDNSQSSSNIKQNPHQAQFQTPVDMANLLKLNDIPYKLTQGLSPESPLFNKNLDPGDTPISLPLKLNQDVSSHQIDAASSILNRYLISKQGLNNNKLAEKTISTGWLPTINGFRIANPYNVDLKLVAEMLKGKSTVDDTIRDQFNKPHSLKLDASQLHELLSSYNKNLINLPRLNTDLGFINNNAYLDIYNKGKSPFHGVKYSRSQEEEESIPIAVSSNNYLIGAVVEQDDPIITHKEGDDSPTGDENVTSLVEDQSDTQLISAHKTLDNLKHSNSAHSRQSYQKKHQKFKMDEPYPLLKPPPPFHPRYRNSRSRVENKNYNRRRMNKRKVTRHEKNTQSLFGAGSSVEDESERTVPTLLRPPSIAEPKLDVESDDNNQ